MVWFIRWQVKLNHQFTTLIMFSANVVSCNCRHKAGGIDFALFCSYICRKQRNPQMSEVLGECVLLILARYKTSNIWGIGKGFLCEYGPNSEPFLLWPMCAGMSIYKCLMIVYWYEIFLIVYKRWVCQNLESTAYSTEWDCWFTETSYLN